MSKKLLFSIILCFCVSFVFGQTRLPGASNNTSGNQKSFNFNQEQELKRDIDEIGLTIANRLMNCCSSWGGTNVGADVDYEQVRENELTGAFTIPMTVKWQGSLTGNRYWIKGKLVVNGDGTTSWLKIKDSGGFNPGCSQGCIR